MCETKRKNCQCHEHKLCKKKCKGRGSNVAAKQAARPDGYGVGGDDAFVLLRQQRIQQNAGSASYHSLLPVSVQVALKCAVRLHSDDRFQKSIAINDVIQRASSRYTHYFKED